MDGKDEILKSVDEFIEYENKVIRAKKIFLLKNIADCALCDHKLTTTSMKGKRYYRCSNYVKNKECTANTFQADIVESNVLKHIQYVFGKKYYYSDVETKSRENEEYLSNILNNLNAQLKEDFSEAYKVEIVKIMRQIEQSITILREKFCSYNIPGTVEDFLFNPPEGDYNDGDFINIHYFLKLNFNIKVNLLNKLSFVEVKNSENLKDKPFCIL